MSSIHWRASLICFSLSLFVLPAIAQPNKSSQASIEGRTFSTDGQPLRKTTLTLHSNAGREAISATSDEQGHFSITGIEPGPWILLADHVGYLQSAYGMRPIPGNGAVGDPVIHLDAGQHLEIDLRLRPQAVILGKVTDEDGDPIAGCQVTALLKAHGKGSVRLGSSGDAVTDNQGNFRIARLEGNSYYISIRPVTQSVRQMPGSRGGPEMGYARAYYYPGVSDVEHASSVEAEEGRETRANIQLRQVSVFHLRGKMNGDSPAQDSAAPIMGVRISVAPQGILENADPRDAETVAPDGSFDISGLTPGAWTITARSLFGTQLVAHATLTVPNRDVNDFSLTSKAIGDVRGAVTILPKGAVGRVERISLEPAEQGLLTSSNGTTASVSKDGAFLIEKVPPLTFRASANVPSGGYLKSAAFNGHDALHAAADMSGGGTLAVVISMTAAEINGKVTGADGEPSDASIVVLPDPLQPGNNDLYHRLQTKPDGTFVAGGLAPGRYRVYAWEELETGAWLDYDYMKPFENLGTPVTVNDNDRKTVTLGRISKEKALEVLRAAKK